MLISNYIIIPFKFQYNYGLYEYFIIIHPEVGDIRLQNHYSICMYRLVEVDRDGCNETMPQYYYIRITLYNYKR